jgi:hypothetical protein
VTTSVIENGWYKVPAFLCISCLHMPKHGAYVCRLKRLSFTFCCFFWHAYTLSRDLAKKSRLSQARSICQHLQILPIYGTTTSRTRTALND